MAHSDTPATDRPVARLPARHAIERTLVRRLPAHVARAAGGAFGYVRRPRRSFSQYGEDLVIDSHFRRVGTRRGVYVDIGAFHPRWLSNTHLLSADGWAGVVVDLDPMKVALFERTRPNCTGIAAAVAEDDGDVRPAYCFERLWSEIDTLSRQDAELTAARTGIVYKTRKVPTIGINSVIERAISAFGGVDFLNLDVEGMDETLLGALDLDRFRPGLICFENNQSSLGGSPVVAARLEQFGYRHLATTGGSHLYALEREDG